MLEYGRGHIARWERLADDAAHAELMVLTTCRIWRFGVEGVHSSKTDAGRWALARDPSLTAVEEALRQRTVDPETRVGAAGIRRLLTLVSSEIAARG